jgi:hypothetical protein
MQQPTTDQTDAPLPFMKTRPLQTSLTIVSGGWSWVSLGGREHLVMIALLIICFILALISGVMSMINGIRLMRLGRESPQEKARILMWVYAGIAALVIAGVTMFLLWTLGRGDDSRVADLWANMPDKRKLSAHSHGSRVDRLEARSLELLSEMQAKLHNALQGLQGKEREGLHDSYLGYTSAHINRAVEGYIFLRKSHRVDASKHLIRTAIEAAIRLQAVRKRPELLFRIAFTEFREDKKWVRSTGGKGASAALTAVDKRWTKFKRAYHAKYPKHPLVEEELSLWHTAECASIAPYYNTHYRLYCRFTHAAFRATTGDLNRFDREDNRTMALCALSAIDALASLGASMLNVKSFSRRLKKLDNT